MVWPFSLWRKNRESPVRTASVGLFKAKYASFRDLLESNSELLQIISDMQEKLGGEEVFGMAYVHTQASRSAFHAARMVKSLNDLSANRYAGLVPVLTGLRERITEIAGRAAPVRTSAFVLGYEAVTKEMVDDVGGKSANLGEIRNRAGLPIPDGFAVTTAAFEAVVRKNAIMDEILRHCRLIDPARTQSFVEASEAIQRLFLAAEIPAEVAGPILSAYDALCRRKGRPAVPVAMRSSAIGEDSELSYAGQYLTVLNVPPERILDTYKLILASLYTPRAISYRHFKGIPHEGIAMSVACLELIESVASGVAYSHHPFDPADNDILVNAVWGLGPYAVDGVVSPDAYHVAKGRTLTLRDMTVPTKPVRLVSSPGGTLSEAPVALELQDKPCLNETQILAVADFAQRLERHFGSPQDIEWALTPGGELLVLQSRPLNLDRVVGLAEKKPREPVPGYRVIMSGGDAAQPGVGCGPAWLVQNEDDLAAFPEGGVLVAQHSSPKFAIVLQKARAVLTDSGSVSGHMASLAREFRVPALFNLKHVTGLVAQGSVVTVDATSRRIYAGEVAELTARSQREGREAFMKGTPVHEALSRLAELVVPLNLTDPKSPRFTPANCRTIHDIMRLAHEVSYQEMFLISDHATEIGNLSHKLEAPIPLDLYVIDLGGGLAMADPGRRKVKVAEVASVPFKALLAGMLHPDLRGIEPRPVNVRGMLSVMTEQMLAPPPQAGERFGDKSYALVSDKYLNFSSRVGYHYSVLDSYCGKTVNKNYVNFQFAGGAAGLEHRNRRARAISRILEALDFSVEVSGDRVVARFQKYEEEEIRQRLDQIGRLLQFTRQMDMLMQDEASIDAVSECFLAGNYSYCLRRLSGES